MLPVEENGSTKPIFLSTQRLICLFFNSVDFNEISILHIGHFREEGVLLEYVVVEEEVEVDDELVEVIVEVEEEDGEVDISPLPCTIIASGSFCNTIANARDDPSSSCCCFCTWLRIVFVE